VEQETEFSFAYEPTLHQVLPTVRETQAAWLSAIESIDVLDRATHELIRLVSTALRPNLDGVARHAQLAAEAGATWEQIVAALVLTEPAHGLLPAVEAFPAARRGFEAAAPPETDDD